MHNGTATLTLRLHQRTHNFIWIKNTFPPLVQQTPDGHEYMSSQAFALPSLRRAAGDTSRYHFVPEATLPRTVHARPPARSDQHRPPSARIFLTRWNSGTTTVLSVEQVLAVTANGSIGYAAYYAAAREYRIGM